MQEAERIANAGKLADAESLCRDVLRSVPELPEAMALLGFLLARQNKFEAAQAQLEAAIARRPTVPQWHFELRQIHRRAYRMDAALAEAREAVRLDPSGAQYRNGLAQIHIDRGETDAGLACILDALARAPEDAESHLSLAHALLAAGNYRPGWLEYEWRFRAPLYRNALPRITRPYWNGMALPGRRLLLAADQGFGDGFQFARYVRLAAERCAGIILLCRTPQLALFSRLPGIERCVTDITQAGEHAAFCWMASLPHVFGTELATIPAITPYLDADPARLAHWRDALAGLLPAGGLRVGLVWSGNPDNTSDWRRSVPLSRLRGLALEQVRLVSLQVPVHEHDRPEACSLGVLDLGARLTDFGETAAVIANLDLVVTVDSAVAHLSGAMGRPAWVLIHQPADWRWLTGRTDSPWYPSLRLFRQPIAGDWGTPIAALEQALVRLARR